LADVIYRSGVKAGVIAFKALKSITRPADTTAYTISDLINGASATGLIEIDFGTAMANQVVELNFIALMSSNGTVATKLDAGIYFFNSATVLSAGSATQKDDNSPFVPTNAELISKKEAPLYSLPNTAQIGTTNYTIYDSEKCATIKLDSNGKIYVAIVANNAYVPASAEVLTIILKGYVMG